MKTSARDTPEQFWIYNNGLTILVHEFTPPTGRRKKLKVKGIGIVNGGQTTGNIGSLKDSEIGDIEKLKVMVRFVKCSDPEVMRDIVRFNNTQNKIEAADFRSGDATQERLRSEFESIPDADYRGARRGGVREA